ncbi:hypothetical protein ACS0TY_001012 [Phlomoides rotata]
MPIPEYPEPGVIPGKQQAQLQQSIHFSSAIPLKKRRFPIFQEESSSPEEKSPPQEESKDKQDLKITDGGLSLSVARNSASPANTDVRKTSPITVKKEVAPTSIQLGEAIVDTFTSKALVLKPSTSLGPLDDLGSKKDILQSGSSSEPGKVMQEIVSGKTEGTHPLELSTRKMNVELSLGPKEPLVSALKRHNSGSVILKSENSDSSLLSLGLHDEKLVLNDKNGIDSNQVCANRSNWDLNTTMDVWEGSTYSDAFAHRLGDIGGLSKTNSCHDVKSSLTTEGTVGLHTDKGKRVLDGNASSFSNVSTQPSQQYKTEDSLRLVLASPSMNTVSERPSLSYNLTPTSIGPYLSSKQVQLSITKVNRVVKSEPADDNSKRDCSVGSSSSSSMELLKFNSVKRELANNHSLETVLQSTLIPEKIVDCRSVKSEVFQEHNQEAPKSDNAAVQQSARMVIQHQDSCSSSSTLPSSLMHQNPCPSRLPTCSELTTSGDLSNQIEQSFHSKESQHNGIHDEQIASMVSKPVSQDNEQLKPSEVGNLSVVDPDKRELAQDDEHNHELFKINEVAEYGEEDMDISPERLEESGFGSDSEPQQNIAEDAIGEKEDEEYEDGEVREPIQLLAQEDSVPEDLKADSLELVESDSRNFQFSVPLGDQNINMSGSEGKDAVKKNQEETHSDSVKDCIGICHEPNSAHNSLPITSDKVLGVVIDEKVSTPDNKLDFSGNDVRESPGKEVLVNVPTNGSHEVGVEQGDEATEKGATGNCSVENDLTLSKVEAPLDGHDTVKDSNNVGNKSRIINLSRASVVTTPCTTKSIPNRLVTTRSGKERYTDLDGEMQPRGNRDEFYTGGSNKFVKGRVHDPSHRNSRPNFMLGKGRISGRFGSLRGGEWDSEHDFSSETSYGPSDYRVIRRKHNSSISDIDLDCNGYGVPQDGSPLGRNRRKTMNDEFPSVRRTSLRRISSGGDRDGPVTTRGVQMLHRIPRNMSPRRCSAEAGSDVMGLRHDEKFMRLSDDIGDPVYNRPQAMYDELDDQHQLVRGERNFSTMQRKGFPRIRSKSPGRSRTRSPGPWSSPRRRSPNGLQELTQHRSPPLYRMRRMRSPDRACFRDEMVPRRRGSPSFVTRHTNDMRDVDSGREHVHPRPAESNRRNSPGRVFPRNARRGDALDSREMGDGGDEYMNGPLPSNKFHELRGDGGIDERRKLFERRGPLRSFRPNFNGENENFQFHMNDGPRPYRFIPDTEAEFVERSNMREREFDGRMKHQPLVRRIRNMEEQQQDGNYRPVDRGVWHEDGGFPDGRGKRRRF